METLHNLKRPFGQLDISTSPLGLGTVKIGRNKNIKNACGDGGHLPSPQDCLKLLSLAKDLGINVIDTAPAYGVAENMLGSTLGSLRKDFHLMTKVGESFCSQTGKSTYQFDTTSITKSLENSLRQLKTDYLDFVSIHCSRNDYEELSSTDVIPTLKKFREKGIIRGIGASIYSEKAAHLSLHELDGIMVQYNTKDQQHQSTLQQAFRQQKAILIKKPLVQGFSNKIEDALEVVFQQNVNQCAVFGTLNTEHLIQNVQLTHKILTRK